MAMSLIAKPEATEYNPYYGTYVSLVPDADILTTLESQLNETLALLSGIDEAKSLFRYALGKWSVKEVIGHVSDTERVFAYRAMRFARNDETALAGFEQNDYVQSASFDDYALDDLLDEFAHVRLATVALFRHLKAEAWTRGGTASESGVTVRALAYIIAGHELHHRRILRERYL